MSNPDALRIRRRARLSALCFGMTVAADTAMWARVVKAAGMEPE